MTGGAHIDLVECLGRGGNGAVWRAHLHSAVGIEREVAVKLTEAGADESALRRLRDEARMLAALRHRSVVHLQDLLPLQDGTHALVMELVDGVNLCPFLRDARPPPAVVFEILAEVADALDVAWHARALDGRALRLMHRDVKPGNVMVTEDGRVKLLDFGIASVTAPWREATTELNEQHGTLGYMSPERQQGVSTPAGDVYSLAVVGLELCTGIRFGRTFPNKERHEAKATAALEGLRIAGVRAAGEALLREGLAYDPADRPDFKRFRDSALAVRAELGGPGLGAWAPERVAALRRAKVIAGSKPTRLRILATTRPKVERSPGHWTRPGLALGGALLLAGVGWAWRGGEGRARGEGAAETGGAPVATTAAPSAVAPRTPDDDAPGTPDDDAPQTPDDAPGTPDAGRVASVPEPPGNPAQPRRSETRSVGPVPPARSAAALSPSAAGPLRPIAETPEVGAVGHPRPDPAPQADELEELGLVVLDGEVAGITLESGAAIYPVPAAVPAGGYAVAMHVGEVRRAMGSVWVDAGALVRLRCVTEGCSAR